MYTRLATLLSHARSLGMLTTVTSNGLLATRARWSQFAPLVDLVAISIDGTPEEHDTLRRCRGAFARTVQNLGVIRASGTPFGLIFTLTQHNLDSLEFVVRLAAEVGARGVQVHPLTLHGRATEMAPDTRPDGIELAAAMLEAHQLGTSLGLAMHVDAVGIDQIARHAAAFVPRRPVPSLISVAPTLILEADGSVMPLTHELSRELCLGSLEEARLTDLAERWLRAGSGDALANLCERTHAELLQQPEEFACYWYEEVALRSRPRPAKAGLRTLLPSAR